MKRLVLLALLFILAGSYCAYSADVAGIAPEKPKSYLNGLSVSPYYTVAFENFDGASRDGVGVEGALPLSKTVSFVTYAESDSSSQSAIDRAGAGLQVTGKLGRLRPFGRLGFGYTWDSGSGLDAYEFYLRPQFGVVLPIYEKGGFSAGLTGSWALDVSLDGETAQRLFGGLGFSFKF